MLYVCALFFYLILPEHIYFPLFCSGKIVSPKWKSFKGLRLLWRDKIRLNNAIWRAWFIQCESSSSLLLRADAACCIFSL